MKNTHTIAIGVSLAIVILFSVSCLFLFGAFASDSSPKQRAAAELPEHLRAIEQTQPACDLNAQSRARVAQIMSCLQSNECDSFLTGGTPAH